MTGDLDERNNETFNETLEKKMDDDSSFIETQWRCDRDVIGCDWMWSDAQTIFKRIEKNIQQKARSRQEEEYGGTFRLVVALNKCK